MGSILGPMSDCKADNDGVSDMVIGWLLTVGTIMSFIPQPALGCTANLLPVLQLAAPWLCTYIIFVLLGKYCKNISVSATNDTSGQIPIALPPTQPSRMDVIVEILFMNNDYVIPLLILTSFFTVSSAALGVGLVFRYGYTANAVTTFANVYGVVALVLLVIQYIPQIYVTHKMKEAGSLSVITLLLQAPGSILVVYFQAIMNHKPWTTWAPYFATAVQQFVLIAQCTLYWVQKRRKTKLIKVDEKQPFIIHTAATTPSTKIINSYE